jgi:hypothetical protein
VPSNPNAQYPAFDPGDHNRQNHHFECSRGSFPKTPGPFAAPGALIFIQQNRTIRLAAAIDPHVRFAGLKIFKKTNLSLMHGLQTQRPVTIYPDKSAGMGSD